jgi:hypothetical protein
MTFLILWISSVLLLTADYLAFDRLMNKFGWRHTPVAAFIPFVALYFYYKMGAHK